MTRISAADLIFKPATGTIGTTKPDTPADALRRLNFPGDASKPWNDVLALGASDLAQVIRTIDDERQMLEHNYAGATVIDGALTTVLEKLGEADALVVANGKSGVTRYERRTNQSKLDKILEEIDTLVREAKMPEDSRRIFKGNVTLVAGTSANSASVAIDDLSLTTMGRGVVNGRSISVGSIMSRGLLDTSKDRRAIIDDARRVIESARDSANALIEQVRSFQRDALIPRLGDVATAMEGLYRSDAVATLSTSQAAMQTARSLRQMTIDSATLATATGADGWDRERTFALLT